MERSELEKIRLEKAARLREAGMEPYPTRSHVTHTAQAALEAFDKAEGAGSTEPITVTVAGRLRAMRPMGKLTFAHIEDSTARIQLFLRVNDLGEEKFKLFNEEFDLGDILEATGTLFRTRTGEITVNVSSFAMLAKSITPLPAAKDEVVDGVVIRHASLTNPEDRFRQRYADLAVNPEVREIFRKRAAVVTILHAASSAVLLVHDVRRLPPQRFLVPQRRESLASTGSATRSVCGGARFVDNTLGSVHVIPSKSHCMLTLKLFVDVEEVFNLPQQVRRDISESQNMLEAWITHGNA